MNTMKKIVAFAMIVSMVLGCLIISTSAAEKKEYVGQGEGKDGPLVAWYDATNNNNGTHDLQSDLWKDLSGNANHIDISSAVSNNQITWDTEKGMLRIKEGGCYLQLPEAVKETLQGDAYTIEIVTGTLEYTATAYITLLSSSNDELSVFIRCAEGDNMKLEYKNQDANGDSNRPFVYDAWNHFNGKTLAVTADLDALDENGRDNNESTSETDNVVMYSDGVRIGSGESEHNMELDYVYFGNTAANREWHGEIYALRIYNRALTADEVKANTEADQFNYRSGQKFEPTEEYDPKLDENYKGFVKLEGYVNNKIVFNADTDLIPLTGFYGSTNLLDYLYPYESDEIQWKGARLQKTEEPDTDYDGNEVSGTNFDIMYQSFCTRAGIKPVTGKEGQYVVIEAIVGGDKPEVNDISMTAVGYDADINDELTFTTGSLYGEIDLTKADGKTSQFLIYDIAEIMDDCESLTKFQFSIDGLGAETFIDLIEISLFADEKAAFEYAGEEYVVKTEKPDEPKQTEPATQAPVTEAPTQAPEVTKAPETEAPKGGCAAVAGFGVAAVMVAAAAAVVLKKKD